MATTVTYEIWPANGEFTQGWEVVKIICEHTPYGVRTAVFELGWRVSYDDAVRLLRECERAR